MVILIMGTLMPSVALIKMTDRTKVEKFYLWEYANVSMAIFYVENQVYFINDRDVIYSSH